MLYLFLSGRGTILVGKAQVPLFLLVVEMFSVAVHIIPSGWALCCMVNFCAWRIMARAMVTQYPLAHKHVTVGGLCRFISMGITGGCFKMFQPQLLQKPCCWSTWGGKWPGTVEQWEIQLLINRPKIWEVDDQLWSRWNSEDGGSTRRRRCSQED